MKGEGRPLDNFTSNTKSSKVVYKETLPMSTTTIYDILARFTENGDMHCKSGSGGKFPMPTKKACKSSEVGQTQGGDVHPQDCSQSWTWKVLCPSNFDLNPCLILKTSEDIGF